MLSLQRGISGRTIVKPSAANNLGAWEDWTQISKGRLMAYTLENTAHRSNPIADILTRLRSAIARRRTYSKVLGELSAMSNRELADLNLCRGDIRRLAREAAEMQ
ncbi:MAG: DUF1127 domain-containing protein [Pseudomonadota bacterium]